MQIHFNANVDAVTRAQGAGTPARPKPGADGAVFDKSEALNKGLEQLPDVRADRLERARAAMVSENYPPSEMVQKIAHLLALNLDPT